MTLEFCSFSSGSNGNCYLIKSETTAILVDAGISTKDSKRSLINKYFLRAVGSPFVDS